MNITIRNIALAGTIAAFLSGIALDANAGGPKQSAGSIIGAIAGAAAGSQVGGGSGRLWAVGVGTLLGAWMGSEIGQSMDERDRIQARYAEQRGLEEARTGQPSTWRNPDTGNRGVVVPTSTYEARHDGRRTYCREYTHDIEIVGPSGQRETMTNVGTACRNPDGTWQIASR